MILKLNIIIGSTRPGRGGPAVAKWVYEACATYPGFEVELVDLADFYLPLLDEPSHPRMRKYQHEHTKKWSAAIEPADAFVFVCPEYDYFPNAALINALQVLSLEWQYKAAAIVSYGGVSGGLRAAQELRLLLGNLAVMAIPQTVPIPFFQKQISEDRVFTPTDPVIDGLKVTLGELLKWAAALKPMRSA
ncbi:NAD(P)H-dependent FMN reductase [Pararhizobium capsulatum DSM 1112]|uniref:NAD(P)H-dependent FMN reductase n=1 Tax=Pararhizobium capsulatum DSM 1112 TaxID=1121113 RepID=A0ABU0BWK4_9HYPH|nr:NAD(P)H-dependent oxidoreductase [Pararhizobium capsulatum]MDQ0322059.1 NAD(P)H-dependent FMN reductase [Pararhizobium capsulatum DSM 1112]